MCIPNHVVNCVINVIKHLILYTNTIVLYYVENKQLWVVMAGYILVLPPPLKKAFLSSFPINSANLIIMQFLA